MEIAVLGTGMVGRIIAARLDELGHQVTMGTRNVTQTLSDEDRDGAGNSSFKAWHEGNKHISLKSFQDAASTAELLINCTGGQVSIAALEMVGEALLHGKILIDIANPLDVSKGMPPSLSPVNTDSLGEQIQRRFPTLKVVKALNTMNANLMVNPSIVQGDHNVFICGNDEGAKSNTRTLLSALGWREDLIIDLGDITNARGTEMLLPIWLRLWKALGTAEFNFHIQKNS